MGDLLGTILQYLVGTAVFIGGIAGIQLLALFTAWAALVIYYRVAGRERYIGYSDIYYAYLKWAVARQALERIAELYQTPRCSKHRRKTAGKPCTSTQQ